MLLAYGIRGLAREAPRGVTRATAVVTLRSEGKRVREERHGLSRPDGRGAETLLPVRTMLSLDGLSPGEYEIEVRVADHAARIETSKRTSVSIRE